MVRYTTLAAISAHPDVNDTTSAAEIARYAGGLGVGTSPKKYSIESTKPVKLPSGVMRPVAFSLNKPGGTAVEPCFWMGMLSVVLRGLLINYALTSGLTIKRSKHTWIDGQIVN
jgi:hypothetical protein